MALVWLVVGAGLAAFGGERFVRGTVGLARLWRIPPGIVAATVAAFATSAPELTVAVVSAAGGDPSIALGDATGSNMVNLGLVLGGAVVVTAVVVRRADLQRDLPTALGALGLLALLAADGRVGRIDAAVLMACFLGWLVVTAVAARRERSAAPTALGDTSRRRVAVDAVLGIVLLVVAGRLLVVGAKGIGDWLGWDEFLAGTVLVAIATSAPELATVMAAIRRGHVEVGVGAVLGSNVFNTLFIVGTAGLIAPIPVVWRELSVALAFGIAATVAVVPELAGRLPRSRGIVLLVLYVAYVVTVLVVQ